MTMQTPQEIQQNSSQEKYTIEKYERHWTVNYFENEDNDATSANFQEQNLIFLSPVNSEFAAAQKYVFICHNNLFKTLASHIPIGTEITAITRDRQIKTKEQYSVIDNFSVSDINIQSDMVSPTSDIVHTPKINISILGIIVFFIGAFLLKINSIIGLILIVSGIATAIINSKIQQNKNNQESSSLEQQLEIHYPRINQNVWFVGEYYNRKSPRFNLNIKKELYEYWAPINSVYFVRLGENIKYASGIPDNKL